MLYIYKIINKIYNLIKENNKIIYNFYIYFLNCNNKLLLLFNFFYN